MSLRPAPGPQLAAGRLRVDAAKAIAKLREYQLVDRTAWILEAIRAAVAGGATAIDLQGDANDVWLSWNGAPWDSADLPRLFDELVSPEAAVERQHIRLLAAAVNSALGANPAYVDVYAIGEHGALRTRYTPDVLVVPDGDDESPLRRLQASPAPVPSGAGRGMHVHFRRRASLEVISYWLRSAPPPELELARWACADIAVPTRIGETTYGRATNARDIVRVPLGKDLDGWLAVVDGAARDSATLELAEHGVLLEVTTIDLAVGTPRAELPLRVFVDAPRMPTNASRSEVRRDAHPVATVDRRAKELVPELVAALAAKLAAPADPRACAAAIRLVGALCAGHGWTASVRKLTGPLAPLAELPLVRDAAGVPRPLAATWSGLVHVGSEPLAEDLAPWLGSVLWAPPGSALRWLPDTDDDALARHVRRAKRERRAQRKFYKHAPREARVVGRRKHRVRARLGAPLVGSCIPDTVFAGVTGEVCVYAQDGGGELALLLEGRDLERVAFDSPVAFEAAIDSASVRPTATYTGAVRDPEYARVERAMRAGVVRALEALALAIAGKFVDGYQVATAADFARDTELLRSGLSIAHDLDATPGAAFANAKLWRTSAGLLSLAELQTHAVLGITRPTEVVPSLRDRVIVYADGGERALLAALVDTRVVGYEPGQLVERISPHELAEQLSAESPHVLAFGDAELSAALAPAGEPRLVICHRGRQLAAHAYAPALQPCKIVVDSDRVVPDEAWQAAADDGGLTSRDYRDWERALARAAVRAMCGDDAGDLIGPTPLAPDGTLARWLWLSLAALDVDPHHVLGGDLLARLRTCSLFRVLGEPQRLCIDELAVMFPAVIHHVASATDRVPGFPVLLADAVVAEGIGKLLGRRVQEAGAELVERKRKLARELRLGEHRAKPPHVRALHGPTVVLINELGNGLVALGTDTFELDVLVEGRLLQSVTRTIELPLVVVFELTDLGATDDRFESLGPDIATRIANHAGTVAGELLEKLADAYPNLLADSGAARKLFAAYAPRLQPQLREHLARTVRFATIDGGRATFVEARSGPIIQMSSWTGDWLGPDGDLRHVNLDRPILAVQPETELATVLAALGNVVDVTPAVTRLQTQRRIARGLLPAPRVSGADPQLTRKLADLGPQFRSLGPGEVTFVADEAALLVHAAGELRERKPLACVPAIELAIEAPDLAAASRDVIDRRLGKLASELAIALARDVLAKCSASDLPAPIRRNLRAAMLAGTLADVRDAAVFETTTGTWIDLATVQAQRELFGQLWCVAEIPYDAVPLDDRRIVLVLSTEHQLLAAQHGIPVIDATNELALDAKTRRNRARPPADSLAIPDDGVLARVALDGDGVTAPRGWIGALAPEAIHLRRLRMFRAMHPFDDASDPCRWPTFAAIDDARFTPERTWSYPERDDIYKQALEHLHRASEEAARAIVTPPPTALAAVRVAPWLCAEIGALRNTDIQIRGALWLDGPPVAVLQPAITVGDASGTSTFVALRGTGLTGKLLVHAPSGWKREDTLEELAHAVHSKLVRELAMTRRGDPDLVSAHVAWALAIDRITADDAKQVTFRCFRPSPLDATELLALLRGRDRVTVVPPFTNYTERALVDDGSETARVIKVHLGARLAVREQPARPRGDTAPVPITQPVAAHPLQHFVDTLHARIGGLGIPVRAWRIVDDRERPLAAYAHDSVLELAGQNRHIIALAAAVAAKSAWANDGVDALAAHCITVLNVALTSITDATEGSAIAKLFG